MIYLASPYSADDPAVRLHRYVAARDFTGAALKKGYSVFSPIVYGHEFESDMGYKFEPWAQLNDSMIEVCSEVWVLGIPGWRESLGICHELELALRLDKQITGVRSSGELFNIWGYLNANYRHLVAGRESRDAIQL